MSIDWVFLDVGGIIFRDDAYFDGLFEAIAAVAPAATRAAYDRAFEELRDAQSGSFTEGLIRAFVADVSLDPSIRAAADERWAERGHHPDELYPEALEVLRTLASRYGVAFITNHFSWVRDRAEEAGFGELVGAWAISTEVGAEKPDPAIFRHALDAAGVAPDRVAMVGDRLDRDVRGAKALGMRTIWVLRNEAPEHPTPEQLAIPDATVRTLEDVPAILERF